MTLQVFCLRAQTTPISINENEHINEEMNQQIELLSEQISSDDADLSSLTETLNYYKSHPINLNHTSIDELVGMRLLSDIQINNLINHLLKNGNLICIYELQSIEGFDLITIKKILPYIYVSDQFNSGYFDAKEIFRDGKHEIIQRYQRILEHQIGYLEPDSITKIKKPNSYYLGDPNKLLARYRFHFNDYITWSLTAEKDQGEEFFKGTQKQGFDFYGAHVSVKNIKKVKILVLGDYQATFGQGLTLWQGFSFGKSSSPFSIKRQKSGIKAYQSFDENRFFRGTAATIKCKNFEITGLVSHKKIDANTNYSPNGVDNGESSVSSLILGGLHNTNFAVEDSKKINQTVLGANASYRKRQVQLSITVQNMNLSNALNPSPTIYNQYVFKGKHNFVGGFDYNYVFKNANIFGESAISANGAKAHCHGIIVVLDPRLTFSAHYRSFSKNFQNMFSNAVIENTVSQNEQGVYLGFEAKLSNNICFTAYLDNYQHNWLKANVSSPSIGRDILTQLTYMPTKKIEMYLRYRNRYKFENDNDNDGNVYDYIILKNQHNIRYHLSAQISPSIKIKSRIEYTTLLNKSKIPEEGVLMMQDVIFKRINCPLAVTLRYAVFDTQGYDSRLYTFENDIPYSFSIPSLYYKGQRFYFIINWDLTKKLELSTKFSSTVYDNQKIIHQGSLNQIDANHQTEIKVQIRAKF